MEALEIVRETLEIKNEVKKGIKINHLNLNI